MDKCSNIPEKLRPQTSASAYRSININHNKRPGRSRFSSQHASGPVIMPMLGIRMHPLCPLFSATVGFLMDAKQQQQQQQEQQEQQEE